MREVGAFEAKNTLGALLDRVAKGEEIVITRHGKPVARLVPDTSDERRERARAAAERILAMRGVLKLDGLTLKELIEEGRE